MNRIIGIAFILLLMQAKTLAQIIPMPLKIICLVIR